MNIKVDPASVETVVKNMDAFEQKLRTALLVLSNSASKQMEAYAKTHAPWQDRTGNARQSLAGGAYWEGDKLITFLCHQVDYGVWLELAMARKYSILEKTMQQQAPRLVKEYKKVLQ